MTSNDSIVIPPNRRRLIIALILAIVLPFMSIPLFIGCFAVIEEGGYRMWLGILGLPLTIAVLGIFLLVGIDYAKRLLHPEPILEIHPEVLLNRSFGSEQRIPWNAIRSIENRNDYFAILLLSNPSAMVTATGYYAKYLQISALRNHGTPVLLTMHLGPMPPEELSTKLMLAWQLAQSRKGEG